MARGKAWVARRLGLAPDVAKLRARGLTIGSGVFLGHGVHIDPHYAWHITIEDNALLGPGAIILAHDAATRSAIGMTRVGNVRIERGAFIGAAAIVLPGTVVGAGAVIGAGAVVHGNIPAGSVWVGNPARCVATAAQRKDRLAAALDGAPTWDAGMRYRNSPSREAVAAMVAQLGDTGIGYLE